MSFFSLCHWWLLTTIFMAIFCLSSSQNTVQGRKREGKLFSVFQVITFPNAPCEGSSATRNGTCYTEQECENKGGSESGTCASGFGVCCIFTVNCGERSTENCTYFESSGTTAGACQVEICPCNDNICQLRLDFDSFVIAGPSTDATVVTKRANMGGAVSVQASDTSITQFTQCRTDLFSVTNPEGPSPPSICGTNSGEHMYVEASDLCNKLSFILGTQGLGTSIPTRAWSIKVTQFSCRFNNLAPQGCVQWFYDAQVNNVRSYNYNNGDGLHLADQDQSICVRRERNNCRICWTVADVTDFALTHATAIARRNPNQCCEYGVSGTKGFDCLLVPFNLASDSTPTPRQSAFCGNRLGLRGNTQCSTRTPFQVHFRSDKWDTTVEATVGANGGGAVSNRGFQLVYFMDSTGCDAASITIGTAG